MFAGGPKGQMETWSPEELVIEASLKSRLGGENSSSATAQAATEAAQKVKGKWTTYFAFRKSNLGIGFGNMPHSQPGLGQIKHDPNDRFARLTPEQRVQRAREHFQFNDR
jgi:hypothetical protein